jgi:hypothetical protein
MGDNPVSGPVPGAIPPPWLAESRQLWSLLDMLRFEVTDIYDHLLLFRFRAVSLNEQPDGPLDDDLSEDYRDALQQAFDDCRDQGVLSADLKRSLATAISRLRLRKYTSKSLAMALHDLEWQLNRRLNAVNFALIPEEVTSYFEQDQLFGEVVYNAFPEARADIKDAGNCIAAELYTASVFHLMRAAELGLRRLARKLKAKVKYDGKPQPLEYAVWDRIITACHNKIKEARAISPGGKREEALRRYSDIADHCLFMKDIWRNNTAHARRAYSQHEAIAAYKRVHDFYLSIVSVLGDRK